MIEHPGSLLLFKASTGFEQAAADTDAERLIAIHAEAVADVWNPYAISYRNLPFLASAMGVNLWPDWWSEDFKRWWVANQWTFKSLSGTHNGIAMGVSAMGGKLRRMITPPALTYPMHSITSEQRAAYVARFPQLRLYPFYARVQLPYLCFVSKAQRNPNGGFLGPIRKSFTTQANAGGRYTRTATLWDKGVETQLTFRKIVNEDMGPFGVRTYDEVVLPARKGTKYFIHEPGKWPRRHHEWKHCIQLGAFDPVAARMVRIPRDGSLELIQAKAIYETVLPHGDLVKVYPEHVGEPHRNSRFATYGYRTGQHLYKKFLATSVAWQWLYEKWFLFDADRVPDPRRSSTFVGNTRLGMPKYVAEAHIECYGKVSPFVVSQYVRGHFPPHQTETINRMRSGVRAAMAVRDTVLIQTRIKRVLEIADAIMADGTHFVGELVEG